MVTKMSKALMTIHGFLSDVHDFGRLYEYLNMYDKVVACKIPGHNDKLDFTKFTVENTLNAVLHCYDELAQNYDKIDVVGYSMGATLATYLCTQRKVHKLVLVAPGNKYINLDSPLATLKFYLRFVTQTYTKTNGSLKQRIESTKKALSPYVNNAVALNHAATKSFFPNINMYTFTTFANVIKECNLQLEDHSPIDVPTLLFRGELDELVPMASVDYVCKHFTNLQKIFYDDVGHMLMLSNRDADFITATLNFLTAGNFNQTIPPKQTNNAITR